MSSQFIALHDYKHSKMAPSFIRKRNFLFLLVILFPVWAFGQLEVTDTLSNQQIVKGLGASDVRISNVTVDCPPGPDGAAYGYFDATNANLDLAEGLIMTNGSITGAIGPNDGISSTINGTPGDPDLDTLVGPQTYDACVVEFDIEPSGDTLVCNYSFASELYPDFVCTQFNDVFGFFISGPDPNGGTYTNRNIALVPDTNLPVYVNSVNGGQPGSQSSGASGCTSLNYSQYYVNNGDGTSAPQVYDSTVLQYNGFTNGLYVKESVVPCQTYHVKLAIAGVSDRAFDSGVFLEAGSMTSTSVNVSGGTTASTGFQSAVEGCVDGLFTFTLDQPSSDTSVVNFDVGGEAINGTDYATIPDSVVFAPGDTVEQIVIDAFTDGLNEQVESVELYLVNQCNNQPYDTSTIFIRDSINVATGKPDSITICRGESIQFQASGSANYNWTPSQGLSSTNTSDPVATPDSSITYVVSTQLGTCTDADSTYVNVIASDFSINLPSDTNICLNQSIQLQPDIQPSGSYDYQWLPTNGLSDTAVANPTASPTDSTSYILDVSSSLCTLSDSINVNIAGIGPDVSATADEDTICPGETVSLHLSKTPQSCGSNSQPCNSPSSEFTLGSDSSIVSSIDGQPYNGFCEDNRILMLFRASELNAIGLSGGTINEIAFNVASKNSTQPYSDFTIKMGCTNQNSVDGFVSGLDVVFTPKQVSTTSGWNTHTFDNPYNWDGSSNLFVEVCYNNNSNSLDDDVYYTATNYNSIAYDCGDPFGAANGCTLASADDSSNARPNTRFSVCQPGLSSNDNVSWSPSSLVDSPSVANTTATVFQPTTFQAEVDTGSGCLGNSSVTVTATSGFNLAVDGNGIGCTGNPLGTAWAIATSGVAPYSYQWSNGATTDTVDSLNTGTYIVTVTDDIGCQQIDSVTITQTTFLVIDSMTKNDLPCFGDSSGTASVYFSGGTPPYSFNWSNGDTSQSINGLQADTFSVTVTDSAGCENTDTVVVEEPSELMASIDTTKGPSCYASSDGQATVSANGGAPIYNYEWNDMASQTTSTADGLEAGNYSVTVTDENGCTATTSTLLTQPSALRFDDIDTVDESCPDEGDGAVFVEANGGTSPFTFRLGEEDTSSEGAFNGLAGGQSYNLSVIDAKGCQRDTAIRIEKPEGVAISFEYDTLTIESSEEQQLNPILQPSDTGGYNYTWEPPNGLSCVNCQKPVANPDEKTNYKLLVNDQNGCQYSETILVDVISSQTLYIPNTFTPNNDDNNDVFEIYGKGIKRIHLQIFNRWGELIFETRDPSEGWDGTYKGQKVSPDVYLYYARIHFEDGSTRERKGSITLLR